MDQINTNSTALKNVNFPLSLSSRDSYYYINCNAVGSAGQVHITYIVQSTSEVTFVIRADPVTVGETGYRWFVLNI